MRLLTILLLLVIFLQPLGAEVIEHDADCYTIHVDQMELDGDESLMDVLMMCPEFLTTDGRTLISDYTICIEGLDLCIDSESFLLNTKARDVSTIVVDIHAGVSNGYDATSGEISLFFRHDSPSDQLTLRGSTYGNAQLYGDYTLRNADKGFSLAATAMGQLAYRTFDNIKLSSQRSAMENVRLTARFDLSERDSLQLIFAQSFEDQKYRFRQPATTIPSFSREFAFIAAYQHAFDLEDDEDDEEEDDDENDDEDDDDEPDELILATEIGGEYGNNHESADKERKTGVYGLVETEFPLFNDHLAVLAGTEHGYENIWNVGEQRYHFLHNDFYLQVNAIWGPVQFTIGDRFRIFNYWQKSYISSQPTWHRNHHNHSLLGIVCWEISPRHTVQGSLSQRHFTPDQEDLIEWDADAELYLYMSHLPVPSVYNSELRYTYQRPNLVLMGSANYYQYFNSDEIPIDEYVVSSSTRWHSGLLWLTLGASFHHRKWRTAIDNFYNLKIMPSLRLSSRTRLSGSLLYISNRHNYEESPNLYANVRMSHYITPRINLFADYHDIAGQKTGNRALTLGATISL